MDYEAVVRGALAVPSIIQDQNLKLATAQRLRQRAGLPNAEGAVDLSDRVVAAAVETLEAGELDPLFGGWEELAYGVSTIQARLPEGLPERESRHTIEMLLTAVIHWVETHP